MFFGNFLVKEKEDAHADPEIQPMKEDDGTFGEYRWAPCFLVALHSPCPAQRPYSVMPRMGFSQEHALPGIAYLSQRLVKKHFRE